MLSLHKNKKLFLSTIAIAAIVIPVATFSINKFMAINDTSAITYAIPEGYTTFTDPNFYDCVAREYKNRIGYPSDDISNGLTDEQLATITDLSCDRYNKDDADKISDTTGLEKLIGLTKLSVGSNLLTSLDVSNNTALTELNVSDNGLISLDVSNNTALTRLNVSSSQFSVRPNKLTSLDVSNNTALTSLNVSKNQLTSLDVSKNTALTNLQVDDNQLTSLDVSNNTALGSLYIDNNQLTSLDLSNNTVLGNLYIGSNQFTSLDLSNNTALTELHIEWNELTSLDLSNNKTLTKLYIIGNKITSLDLSNNAMLTTAIIRQGHLVSLDVSNDTALASLNVDYNQLTSLDVSNDTALTSLSAYDNQLTSLDVSDNTALAKLAMGNNQLTSLDVSNNTALTELDAYNNQLTALDVPNNTALIKFDVSGNQLTSLDVSNNTALTELRADDILIQTNMELDSIKPNIKLDLSKLDFLKIEQSIANTDNYSYDRVTKVVTINNPNETGGYIQVNSDSASKTFKLQIPNFLAFDTNGGNGDFETLYCYPESGTTECPVTTPEIQPTRDGYYFIGWAESNDATSALYWTNETITLDQSKTLYAVWVAVTNNTSNATISTTSKNSFDVASDKACKVLWTGDNGTTWNRISSNTVAGNGNMRKFNIDATQLGNAEIAVTYMGDTNSDKDINVRDARKIVNAIMGRDSLSNIEEILADVNHDNTINVRDARVLVNSIMGRAEIEW